MRCRVPAREPRKIRVAVVDDHLMVRHTMAELIAATDDMVIVGQAADGQQAYELIRSTCPDVVLMDVRMPRMSGVEVTRRLVEEGCRSRVVLHTSEAQSAVIRAAAEAGASGYVLKQGRAAAILLTLRIVDAGGSVWPATD